MKKIDVGNGQFATVDDCDYEDLNRIKWRSHNGYAFPCSRMHQVIMGSDVPIVDHIDGDGLNNTRANLRAVTNSQNGMNRGKQRNNTSGYKGVSWHTRCSHWRAQIKADGKHTYLGSFSCKHEAARAWNKAALELHGEFAYQNIIQELQPTG